MNKTLVNAVRTSIWLNAMLKHGLIGIFPRLEEQELAQNTEMTS